ncbi:MAG: biosynthetic arginine decarboxylase [Myxococcales bacterium]|nr:biosynthetic arginine decarboxylase [Myxococcales bacterium]
MSSWSTRDSAELYGIEGWSNGYFGINEDGNVELSQTATGANPLDLKRVVDDLVRRGLPLPLLIRFTDILRRQVQAIHGAFSTKIDEYGYKGIYRPIMPIKVNQQRHVVEELLDVGASVGLGLEAGSKPELLVALALMGGRKDGLVVCNGYKDQAYIETALLAQRVGVTSLIIVDRFSELKMILEAAEHTGLPPNIGLRAKLATRGSGRWAESGGDRSKFGLSAEELVLATEVLEERGMLDRLTCLHYHIGSQVTAIRAVKEALSEAVRIFADLYQMGAKLEYLDIGGGLAVDYDGSKTNFHASRNYSLEEYASDVVWQVSSTLNELDIPHPRILSESGRALVAHHSVLVFNVLETNRPEEIQPIPERDPTQDEHAIIEDLREITQIVSRKNYTEAYHDAISLKEDALSLFRHGILDIKDRAKAERLYWEICRKIWKIVRDMEYVPEDLEPLERLVAETYYCNFSLFQSVPDSWAVKALFPVMPIHRLKHRPTRRGVLADLTCDSDGKIDQFIGLHDVKETLELHPFKKGEPYFLAVFLVGAYQEILGDLHNLFGDVNAVHIEHDPINGYSVRHVVEGDTVRDVLGYVSYDQRTLLERLRRAIEHALSEGKITFEQSAALVRHFERGLSGYTYLDSQADVAALLRSLAPKSNSGPAETRNHSANTEVYEVVPK